MERWKKRLVGALVFMGLTGFTGCSSGTLTASSEDPLADMATSCFMRDVQSPMGPGMAFTRRGGRSFLIDNNHLGTDVLLPEGQPIYPIGCGVVRLARAANGYGTLAVVIEHVLQRPIELTNGLGQCVMVDRMLSIYGHLRATADRTGRGQRAQLTVGSVVTPETAIGYVQHDSLNGDGIEHLHFGLRLQSAVQAQRSDPSGWFRGYDTTPTQRRWYANPEVALARLVDELSSADGLGSEGSGVPDGGAAPVIDMPPPPSQRPPEPAVMDSGTRIEPVVDVLMMSSRDVQTPPAPVVDAGSARDIPVLIEDRPPSTPVLSLFRYEVRLRAFPHRHGEPYRLRNQWWGVVTCTNTGSSTMQLVDGWLRCDTARLEPFDASLFLPDHPDWGDRGQVGTVANVPERCTPQSGIDWRITDLAHNRVLYQGDVAGLPCLSVGSQDRLMLP